MNLKAIYKYYGTWCAPCKVYAPAFEKVANELSEPYLQFIDVDIDEPENLDLVVKHKIRSVPTTVKEYEDGSYVIKVGAMSEVELKQFLEN
jgi:thiol-disulfide isomerase/thioredoxin